VFIPTSKYHLPDVLGLIDLTVPVMLGNVAVKFPLDRVMLDSLPPGFQVVVE
jgi:hypothetical protein